MHGGKFDADRRRERAREMIERERERERERVAVRWACVIGALITWASLFVSWHRRFVFEWTGHRHVN